MNALPMIEKGIPIPPPSRGGRPAKYPFNGMQIGESFSVPLSGEMHPNGGDMAYQRLKNAAVRRAKTHGGEYRIRTLRGEGVVRCWRIA